jgi:hypothetical protein
MLLAIQENNHGRVGDIVGTHVVDAHSVRRSDELVLLAKKVALIEKGRGHHLMRRANDSVRDTRVPKRYSHSYSPSNACRYSEP